MSTITDKLVSQAKVEWERWGGPVETLTGDTIGFVNGKMEELSPFFMFVADYWRSINIDLDGRDPPAWSAAFISFCFKHAVGDDQFPFNQNHSIYVAKIASGRFPGLSLQDPATTVLKPGDLVWASRTGNECRRPPSTFAAAKAEVRRIDNGTADSFCSHADIVVDVKPSQVDVIGGNVKNAVTLTRYRLDQRGRIRDGRRNFVGVIRNDL